MAGIYVHIPFCHAKCAYCDFFSTPHVRRWAERTAEGIIREYAMRAGELGTDSPRTVYFGGGTPSCLPHSLLERIAAVMPMNSALERTIEVNPEDVSHESAAFWLSLGFNRVSMGIQSLDDSELSAVGRRHTARQALDAISTLRTAGFGNISCDLIYGLPGQTLVSWRRSLGILLEQGPEHLSAYSLGYEPGTRLTAMLQAGKITAVDDDTCAEMYSELCAAGAGAGFEHYEISNFAVPGMRSRHNASYWDFTPYLGLGPGAHSLDCNNVRRSSPSDIGKWLSDGAAIEEETASERLNDRIITGLRTASGLDTGVLDPAEAEGVLIRAGQYLQSGRLLLEGSVLRIPEQYWIVSDAIMCDLLAD
ncbi:MAG: radical SAM family heme chaperone HemW [Muribaculaceae bacterium]|nr:radical SAM family heme chaperone HemW [Muribaculaceae bacterium]